MAAVFSLGCIGAILCFLKIRLFGSGYLVVLLRAKKNPSAFAEGFSDQDSVNRYGARCLATATITTESATTESATTEPVTSEPVAKEPVTEEPPTREHARDSAALLECVVVEHW